MMATCGEKVKLQTAAFHWTQMISTDGKLHHPKQNFQTCIRSQVFIRQGLAKHTSIQKFLLQHAGTTSAYANYDPQKDPPRTADYRDYQVTSQPLLASWGI